MQLPEDALLSHIAGPLEPPLLDLTVGAVLDRAAERWGDALAVADRGQNVRLGWAELRRQAEDLALGFLALDLVPGDRIGIWSLNRFEWTLIQFAAAKAGLILVTINPAYRLAELEFVLAEAGVAALVLAKSFKSSDYVGMIRTLLPEMGQAADGEIRAAKLPALRRVIQLGPDPVPGALAFTDVAAMGGNRSALAAIGQSIGVHAPTNIQFTSGTTGAPKGVTLSHHNIVNNAFLTGSILRLSHADRICIPLPLYHCFALVLGNLAAVVHGAAMVYPGEGFDPLATLGAVAAERCTALYGVPTMFIAQLEHPRFDEFDLTSLRTGIMGGSPCPLETMRKVVDRMHLSDMTICYGMTETSPTSFQTLTTDTLERRVSTVGRVHPHQVAKVVDAKGNTVPRGAAGELCIGGYAVMLGYWNKPEATAKTVDAGGWMHTGDLATLDADGFCRIVGRLKDMVIRGGENLYPREIEEFLYRHPAIQDVQVFGVPDRFYGEELCAWIILRAGATLTEAELRSFCADQIAHQKVPRHIRFVEAFPLTVTGKVQKFMMREAMALELDDTATRPQQSPKRVDTFVEPR